MARKQSGIGTCIWFSKDKLALMMIDFLRGGFTVLNIQVQDLNSTCSVQPLRKHSMIEADN